MDSAVNRYPYNAYKTPNLYENKFINKKLGDVVGKQNTGLQYGYPYIYDKVPTTKEYPIEGKDGPTSIRRKYKKTYKISRVTIDSRSRNTSPQIIPSQLTVLSPNPLTFEEQSNIVIINQPNHGLTTDDFVSFSNISTKEFTLNNPFSTIKGKSVIRMEFPNPGHGLTIPYVSAQNIFINISNVTSSLNVYSLNQINGLQRVFLTADFDDDSITLDVRYIYLQMNFAATETTNDTLDPETGSALPSTEWRNQDVVVNYLFVNGVPLFYLNTGTPVDINHASPYHSVASVINNNLYTINVPQVALETGSAGGDCMSVTNIKTVADGYPTASEYVYDLKKTYKNVVQIKMISSEFPNTDEVIKKNINDKLYWQNLDDETNAIHSITISPGSYSSSELQQEIQTSMNNEDTSHIFTANINSSNNIVTFSSFIQHTLNNAIFLLYSIKQVGTTQILDSARLYIVEPNHKFKVGDTVLITSAPNYNIVPASAIVGEKTIVEVNTYTTIDNVTTHSVNGVINPIDPVTLVAPVNYTVENCMHFLGYTPPLPTYYAVSLPYFTPLPVIGNTPAGFSPYLILPAANTTFICDIPPGSIVNTVPSSFRMFFNFQDTMGNILGFREVGQENSITPFQTTISNTGLYYDEQNISVLAPSEVRNNAINLSGENYFYMRSSTIAPNNVEGTVSNIFAKILLSGGPGKVLFNTFVNMSADYNESLKELVLIDFKFVNYKGVPFDFHGLEHSFTLEIVELLTRPYDINVSSRLGHDDIDYYTKLTPVTRITV